MQVDQLGIGVLSSNPSIDRAKGYCGHWLRWTGTERQAKATTVYVYNSSSSTDVTVGCGRTLAKFQRQIRSTVDDEFTSLRDIL